jgi:hypothetical protein
MTVQPFAAQQSAAQESTEDNAASDAAPAVVVPLEEYRRLRALERLAATADLEVAEADAILQGHREWVEAGRPGVVSHDEAMAELLLG